LAWFIPVGVDVWSAADQRPEIHPFPLLGPGEWDFVEDTDQPGVIGQLLEGNQVQWHWLGFFATVQQVIIGLRETIARASHLTVI
jgi:hypothetical protein